MSPAILLETTNTHAGPVQRHQEGGQPLGRLRIGSAHTSTRVPTYCAFMAGGSVQVRQTNQTITLGTGMDECWMLFWHGERRRTSSAPTTPAFRVAPRRTPPRSRPLRVPAGAFFTKADVPVLVVFQKRPTQIAPGGDNALRVTFPRGRRRRGGGHAAVRELPPRRHRHEPGGPRALPTDVRTRCQTWSQRLKWYPLNCSESRSGHRHGLLREHPPLVHVPRPHRADDWGTTVEKMVPISPAAKLAFDKQTATCR